jgi:hypothetical protein
MDDEGRRPRIDLTAGLRRERTLPDYAVEASAIRIDFLGLDLELELLLQSAKDSAPHRMRLPFECLGDLGDGRVLESPAECRDTTILYELTL